MVETCGSCHFKIVTDDEIQIVIEVMGTMIEKLKMDP